MLSEGKKGVDEGDYELVEYKKGKAFKRKPGKKETSPVKLEIGSCYNFQSLNFPNHFVHNRKGQVWMDEGDFSNKDFKRDTTWKITEGNFAKATGGISIASADQADDDGEPKVCAAEWGKC